MDGNEARFLDLNMIAAFMTVSELKDAIWTAFGLSLSAVGSFFVPLATTISRRPFHVRHVHCAMMADLSQ